MLRKKNDVAITELKQAVDGANSADPTTVIRLARAYTVGGKPDDAIALLDKVMSSADTPAQIKQYAQAERVRAVQAKGGTAPTPAPGAAPATPPVPKN